MKKTKAFLLILCFVFIFASCRTHTHEYSEEWKHDNDKHWVEAICCENEIKLEATHTFNQGEITTQPSCETKGVKTYTCTVCGFTKTEEIAATGHKGGKSNCENKAVCSSCNKEYGELGNHSLSEWQKEISATCSQAGVKGHYECSLCEKYFDADKTTEITDLVIPATNGHNYTALKYDADSHWYECGCGAIKPESDVAHSGGTATCEAKAICEVCEQAYGEQKTEHPYETEWSTDNTKHWHQASCSHDLKKDEEDHELVLKYDATHHWSECGVCGYTSKKVAHSGGNADCENKAVCSTCEQVYGELGDHPLGEWNIEVPATCIDEGIKGHYICKVCEKKFASDRTTEITDLVIPATGDHNYVIVKHDEDSHWYECGCGAVKAESDVAHSGGTATCEAKALCEVCEQPYGELKAEHSYETEWTKTETHHYHKATCSHDVKADEAEHSMKVKFEGEQHWTECEICGYATEKVAHSGGTATCTEKAVCTTCEQPYGEALGHDYGEWIDEVPATCSQVGVKGHYECSLCEKYFDADKTTEIDELSIPATGGHNYVIFDKDTETHWYKCGCGEINAESVESHTLDIKFNETHHWTECGCGYTTEEVVHSGGKATCEAKALCEVCDQSYGELGAHTVGEWNEEILKCTEVGTKGHYLCSVCEKKLEADKTTEITDLTVEAAGHSYNEATYEWSTDLSTCTAKAVCERDESHVVEETVIINIVKVEVTATKVVYTYEVAFVNDLFESQIETVEETVTATNGMVTINAPELTNRVASHDYVIVDCKASNAKTTVTIYYSEVDVWDKSTVSTSLSGAGTEDDPYLIQSGADLAYFKSLIDSGTHYSANYKNTYFKLTKSIDLNGADFMIGYYVTWNDYMSFSGIFDGNNCSIRGLNTVDAGKGSALFGCINQGGIIKNLSVYGTVTGTTKNTGGVVVYVVNSSKIEYCTNYATITGVNTVGGIVANAESGGSNILNCVNYGEITCTGYDVGGIAGSAGHNVHDCINYGNVTSAEVNIGGIGGTSKTSGTLEGNINYGTITLTNSSKTKVGGIVGNLVKEASNNINYGSVVGYSQVGGIAGNATNSITDCVNYGSVNGTTQVGGIVGYTISVVEQCINNGNISGEGNVAGIIGEGATLEGTTGYVKNCTNKGEITNTGTHTGGISGWTTLAIEYCENYGAVTGAGNYAGGIAAQTNAIITECKNYGAVKGAEYTGGIAGENLVDLSNCTNEGTVTGSTKNAGGIVGVASAKITNCTNKGIVSGTNQIGGIAGYSSALIEKCTNENNVSATSSGAVAGIVGMTKNNVTECINRGDVYAKTNGAAGIVGNNEAAAITISDCDNYGSITALSYQAAGIAAVPRGEITGCNNYGTISGKNSGGIAGAKGGIVVNISDCVNEGTLNSTGSIAGIIGNATGTVTNCINKGAVNGKTIGGIAYTNTGSISGCTNEGTLTVTVSGGTAYGIAPDNYSEDCVNTGTIVPYTAS